jgi:hypothetical protein
VRDFASGAGGADARGMCRRSSRGRTEIAAEKNATLEVS